MNKPHQRLIAVAAELARGPNLDERFDQDDRLPKWALRNIERICERQRVLCCIIRNNSDKLRQERDAARAQVETLAEALREIADSFHWGEDTAIKRTIFGLQQIAREALKAIEG